MEVHQGRFGGREDEFPRIASLKPEDVFLEFGELSGRVSGLVIQDMRREDHLISVSEMGFDEIIEQSPFKASPKIGINPGACSADFRGTGIVDQAKRFGEFHMVL